MSIWSRLLASFMRQRGPIMLVAVAFLMLEALLDALGVEGILREAIAVLQQSEQQQGQTSGMAETSSPEKDRDEDKRAARYAYTMLDARGQRLVRAILPGRDACPRVHVDGQRFAMIERRPRNRQQFPVRLCEFELEAEQIAWLDGERLAGWPRPIRKIVVLGDTGCRLTHFKQQGCNNGRSWPFRQIAEAAARHDPDLVIHVGDYHYREASCPDSQPACAGAAFGDNWAAWEQDFFAPARGLLATAPWVFVRGNHEDCSRAGQGWHHFLAPRSAHGKPIKNCDELTAPYTVRIAGWALDLPEDLYLVVLDTAYGGKIGPFLKKRYADWETEVEQALKRVPAVDRAWILLHQPVFQPWSKQPDSIPKPITYVDGQVGMRPKVHHLLLSGDTHAFQAIFDRNGTRPTLLVAGHGGTALDSLDSFDFDAEALNGIGRTDAPEIARWSDPGNDYTMLFEHGYLVLRRDADGEWWSESHDPTGRGRVVCFLVPAEARTKAINTRIRMAGIKKNQAVASVEKLVKKTGCAPTAMLARVGLN